MTKQMEQLQKQQEVLAQKIKEERKIKLEENQLEVLNKYIDEDLAGVSYRTKMHWKDRNKKPHFNFLHNTQPRFEVILKILKKQSARIAELEQATVTSYRRLGL